MSSAFPRALSEREPRFPTAPRWYRSVLSVEDALLVRFKDHIPNQAHLHGDDAQTAGYALNERLGVLAAERMVPGANASPYMVQHVGRYLWAMEAARGLEVVDLGCGDGYGSYLLSWVAKGVIGLDVSQQAISHAQLTYAGPVFTRADLTDPENIPPADLGVCFEVFEHISEAEQVMTSASERFPRLLLSVPNPLLGGSHINPHHVNDWPLSSLKRTLRRAGARRIRGFHQTLRGYAVGRSAMPWHACWCLDVTF